MPGGSLTENAIHRRRHNSQGGSLHSGRLPGPQSQPRTGSGSRAGGRVREQDRGPDGRRDREWD